MTRIVNLSSVNMTGGANIGLIIGIVIALIVVIVIIVVVVVLNDSTSSEEGIITSTPTITTTPTNTQTVNSQTPLPNENELLKNNMCTDTSFTDNNYCIGYQAMYDDSNTYKGNVSSSYSSYSAKNQADCLSLAEDGTLNLDTLREEQFPDITNYNTNAYYCDAICNERSSLNYTDHCCSYVDGELVCTDTEENECKNSGQVWCPIVLNAGTAESACSTANSSLQCCKISNEYKMCMGYSKDKCDTQGEDWIWCNV